MERKGVRGKGRDEEGDGKGEKKGGRVRESERGVGLTFSP